MGGGTPQLRQNICPLNKFLEPHFMGFPREWPKKILGDKIQFAAQQLYTKIDLDVLWFRKRRAYKIGKKKTKKKMKNRKKKKPQRGQIWVGWDEIGFLGKWPQKNFGRQNCVCSSTTLNKN